MSWKKCILFPAIVRTFLRTNLSISLFSKQTEIVENVFCIYSLLRNAKNSFKFSWPAVISIFIILSSLKKKSVSDFQQKCLIIYGIIANWEIDRVKSIIPHLVFFISGPKAHILKIICVNLRRTLSILINHGEIKKFTFINYIKNVSDPSLIRKCMSNACD